MKKKWISVLAVITIFASILTGCKGTGGLTEITLNEVAHSIFYAPMYVAIEKGYFEEEGLKVDLVNGLGADKTMTAVLSGDCDIGFMGAEATIYVYNEGAEDYVVNFAQLTQRAGNFLVSRDNNEEFDWNNLKGKTVIGGRPGGMPQMVFEYILKKHGMDPKKDLTIIQNIDFGLTSQAFSSGEGDYTIEFEPAATALELEGVGKVVASLGVESGKVPYTTFAAKKSYIEKNPEIIQKFTNAIQKGLDFVATHSPKEIAEAIQPQFAETDREKLVMIVTRYYEQDTWKDNLIFEEESLTLLQDILEEAGELSKRVPYQEIITRKYAEEAAKK
ncbi:ABC transporter substrate-binding protein [Lachnospiraceae bacterium MD1]|uniref:ABC transporter substrate-binding protein n=1 Tax=Variimorphobacter saccharofermentans TaxID=2755051 RepID=A0A839K1K0_9FIRM|nr:ABC transporter substrate-binding protein [Variimorphobacter saccharofermentans]MBB2183624.1 ABC transporter substrate-binding protein [Variimorphobacter saccharofermentans]